MKNIVKHIGLQVAEKDIKDFYISLLGIDIMHEFSLKEEDALNIFGIAKETKVIYAKCGDIELELFVSDKQNEKSFNHVCINTDEKDALISKAQCSTYFYHIREKMGKQTLFLKDSNNNIFEFKDIET